MIDALVHKCCTVLIPDAAKRGERIVFLQRHHYPVVAGSPDNEPVWMTFKAIMEGLGYQVSRGQAAAGLQWCGWDEMPTPPDSPPRGEVTKEGPR